VNIIVPKLITGGSLESLIYAYMTETPIVLTQPYVPFELEEVEYNDIYQILGYSNNTPITKVQVWDRLVFILSMAGLVMMPNNVRTVRQEGNKIIFSLNDNTRFTIAYERKISFDTHLEKDVTVYDWFDIKSGSKLELKEINDKESNLVNKIIFYDSVRKGNGGKGRKDLVAISKVKTKDILEYENSEGYVRLKTIQMMKDEGLRGRPNGYNKLGKQLFYAINIEHTHREIIKKYKPKYTIEEIFKQIKQEKDIWKLTKKLLHQKQISILRESSRLPVDVLI
jgi:hypothetical protein